MHAILHQDIPATGVYERHTISPATQALLCAFAAVDLARPLPTHAVDWDEAFAAACRHGLIGIVQRYLREQPEHGCPASFCAQVGRAYRAARLHMAVNERLADEVLERLRAGGVIPLVLKGPVLAASVYPQAAMRLYSDLDIVVREQDWQQTHQLLCALGFEQEEGLPQPPPKLIPASCPYETKYWHRRTGCLVEVHYDDLLNAGLATRLVEGFWQRAQWVSLGRQQARALALDDHLLVLCAHAHYHGYTRLSWLSDLALIVRDCGAQLDWARFVATVRAEEAQVGVYYSLLVLRELLGIAAPAWVCDAVRPGPLRRWAHERYMPLAGVLCLQPMWRPDFSFYHLPLFKRMLPDLLVMGRRHEKLRYLARLVCPPPAWLRHYYRLDAHAPLALHYLLHPLKLLYHYATEVPLALGWWKTPEEQPYEP